MAHLLLLNKYTYHMHMLQVHPNMLDTICLKNYTYIYSNMVLSGTYGCANIIVHASSFMSYNTKEMCVFVLIYIYIAAIFFIYNVAIIVSGIIVRNM